MTWVDKGTKGRFAAVARHEGLSDSALLRRLVDLMLQSTHPTAMLPGSHVASLPARATRLTIRLRGDDQILLQERAAARGMPPATYVSVLTRAHLRSLPPLPKEEYLALKRTISELGSVGRNLNQIARAANQGRPGPGLGRDDFKTMFRLCEGLRDHVKGLLSSNLKSWEQGYAEPNE